jgi:hypothetical protein
MTEKIYSVHGKPPPKPESYPHTVQIRNACGGLDTLQLHCEDDWYKMNFWYFMARPMGHSQVLPNNHETGSEDAGVRHDTANAIN